MIPSQLLDQALQQPLDGVDLSFLGERTRGKVRDIYRHDDELVLITTDRLSAFDHILGLVPYKGQVLNQLSAFWFEQTADIVGNHLRDQPHFQGFNRVQGSICQHQFLRPTQANQTWQVIT